jgi:hypothetical protein
MTTHHEGREEHTKPERFFVSFVIFVVISLIFSSADVAEA